MKNLNASTLHETLVAMIIIGIIFLIIIEGGILLKKYTGEVIINMENDLDSVLQFYSYNKFTIIKDSVMRVDTLLLYKDTTLMNLKL